jgi:hypothetical protein
MHTQTTLATTLLSKSVWSACVALGHGDVKCVVVSSDVLAEAIVKHVHIDVQIFFYVARPEI